MKSPNEQIDNSLEDINIVIGYEFMCQITSGCCPNGIELKYQPENSCMNSDPLIEKEIETFGPKSAVHRERSAKKGVPMNQRKKTTISEECFIFSN